MFRGNCLLAKLLTALSLSSGVAWSEEGSPQREEGTQSVSQEQKNQAKTLYEAGVAAYRAGQFSEAIDKLLEADRVMPNAAFSYNIALVYQAMGDKRSALRWLRDYLRQSADKDEKATEKVRAFEAELQAKGLQQVTVLSKPAGATMRIDGSTLGITPFTTEIVPGSHYVTLTLDGYRTAQKPFDLRPDRSIDISVVLKPSEPVTAPASAPVPATVAPSAQPKPSSHTIAEAPSPPPAPTRTSPGLRSVTPPTWIGLGLGTALVGTGIVFEFMRASAEGEARRASQSEYASDYDTMKSRQTAARAFAISGGVVLTTGIILLTLDLTRTGPVKFARTQGCGLGGFCASVIGNL